MKESNIFFRAKKREHWAETYRQALALYEFHLTQGGNHSSALKPQNKKLNQSYCLRMEVYKLSLGQILWILDLILEKNLVRLCKYLKREYVGRSQYNMRVEMLEESRRCVFPLLIPHLVFLLLMEDRYY